MSCGQEDLKLRFGSFLMLQRNFCSEYGCESKNFKLTVC